MARKSYQIKKPDGSLFDFVSLAVASDEVLEEVFIRGTPPSFRDLEGWEFRGYNTWDVTHLLGIRKFKKGFYRDSATPRGELWGYNVQIEHNGLGEEWNDIIRQGKSVKHGWYRVYPVKINEIDNKYLNALLINYDCDRNPLVDPTRFLRDYLVQVYPDNTDLYLGKAYVAFSVFRICVTYFILDRSNPATL
ncbi:hypothetical protein ACFL27_04275 [candidate division CSSED10-310 bacterium]|uniref:Uncharacterized protein n=1 Tax=candidate division CSSED10-310 bacterium TaxID=2855610 RepID=A0ABV6YTA3_UNCC1